MIWVFGVPLPALLLAIEGALASAAILYVTWRGRR